VKRVVFYGPGDVRVEPLAAPPACEDGGLLVQVEAAAICGSDIKAYHSGNPKLTPGCTMGHEFVGRVAQSRSGAFQAGDRVTMATTIGCGQCAYCAKGEFNRCPGARAMGFKYDGAMSSFVAIPKLALDNGNVVPVSEALPREVAALAEPMSCVMNGLSRFPAGSLSCALVIGMGALGLLHAIALKERGVGRIACCEFPGVKKDMADALGFQTLTPGELKERYLELSDGLGFELVVLTAPANAVQAEAPMYARRGGYVSYFASLPVKDEQITLSSRLLHYNELTYYGTSDSTARHVRLALRTLENQAEAVASVVTVLPIDQALEGMLGVTQMRYAKVVLLPEDGA